MEENSINIAKQNNKYNNILGIFMLAIGLVSAVLFSFVRTMDFIEISRAALFIVLITFVTVFYIKSSRFTCNYKHYRWVIGIGFSLSIFFSFLTGIYNIYFMWLLGAILISSFVDTNIGLFVALISVFLMSVTASDSTETMVYKFIICSVVIMASKFLKNIKNMFYVVIIAISCDVTLKLITAGFNYNKVIEEGLLYDIASLTLSIIIVYILHSLLYKEVEPEAPSFNNEGVADTAQFIIEQELSEEKKEEETPVVIPVPDVDTHSEDNEQKMLALQKAQEEKLNEILSDSYELLVEFKKALPDVYKHSMRIGELSCVAAEIIGVNSGVARAGGYYHEIGRMVSNNYIKEGIILANKNGFPKPVVDVIKQHNTKIGPPRTPEATIVMLSDSILSSIEFMKKDTNAKKLSMSPERLVNGIFDARLSSGLLDLCGISLTQYKLLKNYYVAIVREEGIK